MKKSTATPVVAEFTVEQQFQVMLDASNADFDLDIAAAHAKIAKFMIDDLILNVKTAPVVVVAVVTATPKRTAVLNVEAIKAELAPVLGIKNLAKMSVKFGKGTCALKIKEEGKPTRNLLTLNEVYRKQDGSLVMALNLNSLPVAGTVLPQGVERKGANGYFKHNGLTITAIAEIIKLNF